MKNKNSSKEDMTSARPIAIIGKAFRFPGDQSNDHIFWSALKKNKDFIGQISSSRWATGELQHSNLSEPGRSQTFAAGVLSDIDRFDSAFFGISPREAAWLDPQQRLLLELSWEAMENGGIVPSSIAGSECAVYVGISSLDYGTRGLDDLASLTSHYMTGNTLSMAANRLSYFYDLHGPSLAVDTACSSSLVALHHACNSIRSGEASAAIVGGVSLLLHPYPFIGFTKASMLSADGRSKTFDASADGYVRAEGGAVVLLKDLDKALEDGDSIEAVILASGVNTDGGRKTGITIPSQEGQIELMDSVLTQSGLSPSEINYLEAHGTGTPVGDPIETAAIAAVYGKARDKALPIGSVKSNIGHMEAASGMGGLIKALLVLKNREVVATLHLKDPNPEIDFPKLNLKPVTENQGLQAENNKSLVVGVNSFGFGGANAHVLLQEPPTDRQKTYKDTYTPIPPLFLSAQTDNSLKEMAELYAALLTGKSVDEYYDIAYATIHHRERLGRRLALAAASVGEVKDLLSRFAQGESHEEIVLEKAPQQSGSIAFVYSGNGSQWVGMGLRLLKESEKFQEIVTNIDVKIEQLTGYSVIDELVADELSSRLGDTVVAQPLLFTIQVACTLLLRDLGVEPVAVTGHSVGEIAAAWASGALDLDQAIKIVVERSAAQGTTRGAGKMAAIGFSVAEFNKVLDDLGGGLDVTVAGINSQNHLTISGSSVDLKKIQEQIKPKSKYFKFLDIDYAFHSRKMDPIKASLEKSLAGLEPSPTTSIVFVSTVTGEVLDGVHLDSGYWWRNVREPVRFSEAVAKLEDLGCSVFIEIGPRAILKHYIKETLAKAESQARVLPLLRCKADGYDRIREAALRCNLLTETPKTDIFFPRPGNRVCLPNYPWQREQHWHPSSVEKLGAITRHCVHPLLGWRLYDDRAWENILDPALIPWLQDHKVGGSVVFPGSAYVEMALAAAKEWLGDKVVIIENLEILAPLVFLGENSRTVRLVIAPRDGSFTIHSKPRLSTEDWTLHVTGRVLAGESKQTVSTATVFKSGGKLEITRDCHYHLTAAVGLEYGPTFQLLDKVNVLDDQLEAQLLSDRLKDLDEGYIVHPALLDICYQTVVDFFQAEIEAGNGATFLPVRIGRFELLKNSEVCSIRAKLRRRARRSVVVDFELLDIKGLPVALLQACRFRVAPLIQPKKAEVSTWDNIAVLCPHPAENLSTVLPSSKTLKSLSRARLEHISVKRQPWFREILPLTESLALSFAFEAFHTVTSKKQGGLQSLIRSEKAYIRWLVALLQQEGLLFERQGTWHLAEAKDIPKAKAIWLTLLSENPSCLPQLTLLGRVGFWLSKLLEDEISGADFLGSLELSPQASALYSNDPAFLGTRIALQNTLSQLARSLPEHRRLRVLEISTGPSELPQTLLNALPEYRFDYVLAIDKDSECDRQQILYEGMSSINVVGFDHENWQLLVDDPLEYGFDVVILQHVAHRAADPHSALTASQSWLAEGGLLLLAERYPDWSADLIAGLNPGWWHEQELSSSLQSPPVSSLCPPEVWLEAMRNCGYAELDEFVESEAHGVFAGSFLILGKRPLADNNILTEPDSGSWIFLVDNDSRSVAEDLCPRFEGLHQQILVAEQLQSLDLTEVTNVVCMLGWGCKSEEGAQLISRVFNDVQVVGALSVSPPRLWLVTSGGALVSELEEAWIPNPVQTALWGFGRVVMNELSALNCTLIDLSLDPNTPEIPFHLENELLRPDGNNEIVLGLKARYILQMVKSPAKPSASSEGVDRYYLDFKIPGKLTNAVWLPQKDCSLGAEEVEVATRATGLNFRDIMYLMGLLPDEAVESGFAGASLGLEFSGVISRVGSQVVDLSPGDHVLGFGSSCFSSHIVTNANAVAKMPSNWSFESAATVPTIYLTVYYGLKQLADLQPGERVLIHGAAGGIGISAIRLARHLGAEIFATAGNEEKRDFVRLLGADHVFDSRSLSFADDILAVTNGEGVDVVLNSLAGEAIRRSLQVLKPFGRFLELGKRDFFENTPVGLRYFKDNISYFGVDVDQLFSGRPGLAGRLLKELMSLFNEGVLSPLPHKVYQANRIHEALYEMREARHIGKIVVSFDGAKPHVKRADLVAKSIEFDKSSTWIVTGGLEGFGLESAQWLAAHGVGNLAIISRRGEMTPGAQEAISELTALGANVLALSCDVTDLSSLSQSIDTIKETMPALKGILHAAMVIDDKLIMNLSEPSITSVVEPKLIGAWNLHKLTLDTHLDYFVLYSSITTSIGNPGQGNYVAANGALEGLTRMRRQMDLPATCIGLGPVGDAGYLTRNGEVLENLKSRLGKSPLTAAQALGKLGETLSTGDSYVAAAEIDLKVLSELLPSIGSSRFAHLLKNVEEAGVIEDTINISELIARKAPEEIIELIRNMATQEVAEVLHIKADRIEVNSSLRDYGLDSLMAVDLALGLEQSFGIQLPVMMLNESPTIDGIATFILEKLTGDDLMVGGDQAEVIAQDLARQHGEEIKEIDFDKIFEDDLEVASVGGSHTK